MTISNFSVPTFSTLAKLTEKEPISIEIKKEADLELRTSQSKEVDLKETKSELAEKAESTQKTSIDIKNETSYSTYNIKKQVDEQGLLKTDSPNRIEIKTDLMRHNALGRNISILV